MGRHRWNVDVDISTLKMSTLNISLQFPCDSTRILFILFLARALPVWACFVFLIVFSYCSKATSQDIIAWNVYTITIVQVLYNWRFQDGSVRRAHESWSIQTRRT